MDTRGGGGGLALGALQTWHHQKLNVTNKEPQRSTTPYRFDEPPTPGSQDLTMAKAPAKKPSKMAAFEKSGMDKDKGMKEGGKKDKAVDKKQFALFTKGKK